MRRAKVVYEIVALLFWEVPGTRTGVVTWTTVMTTAVKKNGIYASSTPKN